MHQRKPSNDSIPPCIFIVVSGRTRTSNDKISQSYSLSKPAFSACSKYSARGQRILRRTLLPLYKKKKKISKKVWEKKETRFLETRKKKRDRDSIEKKKKKEKTDGKKGENHEGKGRRSSEESEKIGIYKTPVRPIKQRPIPSGDRDGSRRTCSVKTASRQETGAQPATTATPEDWTRRRFLRLHDGSKVLRSSPWNLHGCKAADEIPVCARVRLPALAPDCIGQVWQIYASFMPRERG